MRAEMQSMPCLPRFTFPETRCGSSGFFVGFAYTSLSLAYTSVLMRGATLQVRETSFWEK
jgi:hypothetical protein